MESQRAKRLPQIQRVFDRVITPVPWINRFDRRIRRDVAQYRAEYDDAENDRSSPPSSERLRVHCVWITEFYGPTQRASLLRGVEKLGWDVTGRARGRDRVTEWIRSMRTRDAGGSWFNLGAIVRPDATIFPFAERRAPLPAGISHAFGSLESFSSALTAVTMQFVLDEALASQLETALRMRYRTYASRNRRSAIYYSPTNQKADEVRRALQAVVARGAGWFTAHLPGVFSGGLLEGAFPSMVLLTTELTAPFTVASRDLPLDNYLWLLGLDRETQAWVSAEVPEARLSALESDEDRQRATWVLAGLHAEIFGSATASADSENETQQRLNMRIGRSASFLALSALLGGYAGRLATLRDQLDTSEISDALRTLRNVQGKVLGMGNDVAEVAADLRDWLTRVPRITWTTEFEAASDSGLLPRDLGLLSASRARYLERASRLIAAEERVREVFLAASNVSAAGESLRVSRLLVYLSVLAAIAALPVAIEAAKFLLKVARWYLTDEWRD